MAIDFRNVDGIWTARVELETWKKYWERTINVDFKIGGDEFTEVCHPTHLNTCEFILMNQEEILEKMISSLFSKYPTMQNESGYVGAELNQYMPHVFNASEFKNLIKPENVVILNVVKDGLCYVGYQFRCTWDSEHGFGILTHKNRIVEMGEGDVAVLSWIAEEDKEGASNKA